MWRHFLPLFGDFGWLPIRRVTNLNFFWHFSNHPYVYSLSENKSLTWELFKIMGIKPLKNIHWKNKGFNLTFLFYQGFLSQTLTIHRTAGQGRGWSFIPLYHFHQLTKIKIFVCNLDDYHVFLMATGLEQPMTIEKISLYCILKEDFISQKNSSFGEKLIFPLMLTR